MRKRDEVADPRSCLNKAGEEEPLFVLRAHDSFAPGLVRMWANQVIAANLKDGVLPPEVRAKVDDANALADAMEAWGDRKVPD